jgi:hypothetical protein
MMEKQLIIQIPVSNSKKISKRYCFHKTKASLSFFSCRFFDPSQQWYSYDYDAKELCVKTIKALPQLLHAALTYHVCKKYGLAYQPGAISLELVSDEVKESVYAVANQYCNKRIEEFCEIKKNATNCYSVDCVLLWSG